MTTTATPVASQGSSALTDCGSTRSPHHNAPEAIALRGSPADSSGWVVLPPRPSRSAAAPATIASAPAAPAIQRAFDEPLCTPAG